MELKKLDDYQEKILRNIILQHKIEYQDHIEDSLYSNHEEEKENTMT